MSEPKSLLPDAPNPIAVLADAVNQLAIVVEEIGYYASQTGYTDRTNARRRRWRDICVAQREAVAELIPE